MTIGEKIKKIRSNKLMTQAELAGTEITRNMLSQIETGVAQPSLGTIRYLASRLNVSPGFLLAEGDDEVIYLKHNEIADIKKAFMNEDFRICRDMCLHSAAGNDDEIKMILAECELEIAAEEFRCGNLRNACSYLDEAIESCAATVYHTEFIVAKAGAYFRYMRLLSATLTSNITDEEALNPFPAFTDEFCRYSYCFGYMETGENSFFADETFVNSFSAQGQEYALHLSALKLIREKNFSEAYEKLHSILIGQQSIAEPMLYFIFRDLEICCRELQDFRGAYEYSGNKITLMQKLLT